jgi:hypothetical protein
LWVENVGNAEKSAEILNPDDFGKSQHFTIDPKRNPNKL